MLPPSNTSLDGFAWPSPEVDFFKELEKVEPVVSENPIEKAQVVASPKGEAKSAKKEQEAPVAKEVASKEENQAQPIKQKEDEQDTKDKQSEDYFAKYEEQDGDVAEDDRKGKSRKPKGGGESAEKGQIERGASGSSEDIATLQYLIDRGLVDIEDGVDLEEVEADDIKVLIEEGLDARRQQEIEDRISSLPDEVKGLVKYSLEGGDHRKYISALANGIGGKITEKIDLSDAGNQELVVREMLRRKGNDDEDIDLQIEVLNDKGTLERYAKSKFEEWKRENAEEQARLIAQQEEQKRAQIQASKEAKMSVRNYLSSVQEIGSVPIPNNIKNTLPSYIHDRTVKLKDGSAISEFQRDLYYGLLQSKEGVLQMAVLLKNLNKERTALDLGFVERNGGDKNAKQVRANIRRIDSAPPSRSKTPAERAKSLIEMLQSS